MRFSSKRYLWALLAGMACLSTGCAATMSARTENASETAMAAQMQKVRFKTPFFVLTGWQKTTQPGQPVHIYIEGDGLAWLSRSEPSLNPTPKHPVGVKLAGLDPSANVLYLARPCQYTPIGENGNEGCNDPAYWLGKRFSQEIVNSYMNALDQVAAQTGAHELHLTGYSGGANIAGLLAARRVDVTLLRTVAGNVDNDTFTKLHDVSAMPYSLNMANDAANLSQIPQIHFIGADDKIVPKAIYESYARKMPASSCLHYQMVTGVSHDQGWEEQWPRLLALVPQCD